MTSKYDQQLTERHIAEQLDESEKQLSAEVKDDIRMATRSAILRAKRENETQSNQLVKYVQSITQIKFALPALLAVALLYVVDINNSETIPALPADLLSMELPSEDLGLLEDLEFADWLAEQEATL